MSGLLLGSLCLVLGAGLVALLVVAAVASGRRVRERRAGLAWWAAQHEWSFLPTDSRLVGRFAGSPFGRGSQREATNVVHGRHEGRTFTAFDYSYVTTSTDGNGHTSSTTHRYSVIATPLGVPVPSLSVAPQGGVGRFFGRLFGTDLLLGDPPFDDRYAVSADDPRFAADVLHPGMRQMLVGWGDLAWRFSVDSLLLIGSGAHLPAEIEARLGAMRAILDQVPEQVWTNLGVAPEER